MHTHVFHDTEVSNNLREKIKLACAFPVTEILNDGTIACLYRSGTEKHSYDGVMMLQLSHDRGETWTQPQTVIDQRDQHRSVMTGGLCQTRDGDLLVNVCLIDASKPEKYVFSDEGKDFRRWHYTVRSSDGGQAWGKPQPYTPEPFDFAGIITKPLVLSDGVIFMPHSIRTPYGPLGSGARVSHDHGQTFEPMYACLQDTRGAYNFCDSYYTQLVNGDLLSLIWTFRHDNNQSVNLHQSISKDQGQTWTTPADTGLTGETCAPLALSDGSLLAAVSYRQSPQGIRLYRCDDGGEIWDRDGAIQMWDLQRECVTGELVTSANQDGQGIGNDIWKALPSYSFGTPNLIELDDGSLLLIYYALKNELFHIRSCRFKVTT